MEFPIEPLIPEAPPRVGIWQRIRRLPEAVDLSGEVVVGRLLVTGAMLWAFAAAAWGIDGTFPEGHFAAVAGSGTGAANMWKHGIPYPVVVNVEGIPSNTAYYMHHPLGLFWVLALLFKLLGMHNWVVRLPAVIYSVLTPFFIYRMGTALWGQLAGGVAALALVALPMWAGFANFNVLELPVIFGATVGLWGYVRFVGTGYRRYAIASVVGLTFAMLSDWPGYFVAGFLGALVFARSYLLPERWAGPPQPPLRAAGRYLGALVVVVAVTAALHVRLMVKTGKFTELVSVYGYRSAGSDLPLKQVLLSRRMWIEMMFPRLALALGVLGVLVIVGRWIARRDHLEGMPLVILATATLQYVHFKNGADFHIFWPHYFAPYFGLAAGALARTLADGARWLMARAGERVPHWWWARPGAVALVAAAPVLVAAGFVLRDGAEMVRLGRETGGRYNSPLIQSEVDKVVAMKWFLASYPVTEPISFHPGSFPGWAMNWEIWPRPTEKNQPLGVQGAQRLRLYSMDTRTTPLAELKRAAADFHVIAVGPYWFIDRAAPRAPIDAHRFEEREPTFWEHLWSYDVEPVRRVHPRMDPWLTWEWREALGQQPLPRPPESEQPVTLDQLRIAYNMGVARNQITAAADARVALTKALDLKVTADYDDGTKLLGAIHHRGAEHYLWLLFQAGGANGERRFSVRGSVGGQPWYSSLARHTDAMEIAFPPPLPMAFWRQGYLYGVKVTYRKRPGTEAYSGQFVATDRTPPPKRVGGPPDLRLVTVR